MSPASAPPPAPRAAVADARPPPGGAAPLAAGGWLVDGHTHFQRGFDAGRFVAGALAHFAAARRAAGLGGDAPGCLLLAEPRGDPQFERLRDALTRGDAAPYTELPTAEPESLVIGAAGALAMAVVRGRQLATRERLEVLLFGGASTGAPLDGEPAAEVLAAGFAAGATVIVPWGFGKWWGARGRLVERLVREHAASGLLLGDNAGRPRGAPAARAFRAAAAHGVPVLPGSDPLPLRRHARRAGRFGALLPCRPDPERPAAQVLALLARRPLQAPVFGARVRPPGGVLDQLQLRLLRARGPAEPDAR